MRLLLHACCGPCLLEPLAGLRGEHEVSVVYANPNIHPLDEYRRRRDTLAEYAGGESLDVIEVPYDPEGWMRQVGRFADDPERRCAACYRLRLEQTAAVAAEAGFQAFATTLTVSPYQDPDAIRSAARRAASDARVDYVDTDFRSRYRRSVERSRELGMYRQRYCGCSFSEREAEESRASRKGR